MLRRPVEPTADVGRLAYCERSRYVAEEDIRQHAAAPLLDCFDFPVLSRIRRNQLSLAAQLFLSLPVIDELPKRRHLLRCGKLAHNQW